MNLIQMPKSIRKDAEGELNSLAAKWSATLKLEFRLRQAIQLGRPSTENDAAEHQCPATFVDTDSAERHKQRGFHP